VGGCERVEEMTKGEGGSGRGKVGGCVLEGW